MSGVRKVSKKLLLYLSGVICILICVLLFYKCKKADSVTGLKTGIEEDKHPFASGFAVYLSSQEDYVELLEWQTLLWRDYAKLQEWQEAVRLSICNQLVSSYKGEETQNFQLIDTCMLRGDDGTMRELYLIRYDNKAKPYGKCYCGILADYSQNTSQLLFQTDEEWYGSGIYETYGVYEFYDMQVSDIDGNREEDIIVLLGEHRSAGAEYYLPDICCISGMQEEGVFHFACNHTEEWLEQAVAILYREENENRKIEHILTNLKEHYGNTVLPEAVSLDGNEVEEYRKQKEEKMLKKIENRSLFYERELLCEYFFFSDEGMSQSIKVYRENGDNGPGTQIGVYIFDYETEEIEKVGIS